MTDAKTLTHTLGGRWHGRYGWAPCPICQPDSRAGQDALTLADGRAGLLAHCKKSACRFAEIAAALGLRAGDVLRADPAAAAQREAEARAEAKRRAEEARRLWSEAEALTGTAAERDLRGRGLTCALPATLRYHPAAWHGPTAARHPAMVALVDGAEGFAVHRTFLRPDGAGKAGLSGGDKMMLGNVLGGAVRLSGGPSRLVVGEGLETSLALSCGLLDAPATIWAALSAAGLRALRLPREPGKLTIAQDGDPPGRDAARALAERAHALGWQVGILDPGDGRDFADILTCEGVAA